MEVDMDKVKETQKFSLSENSMKQLLEEDYAEIYQSNNIYLIRHLLLLRNPELLAEYMKYIGEDDFKILMYKEFIQRVGLVNPREMLKRTREEPRTYTTEFMDKLILGTLEVTPSNAKSLLSECSQDMASLIQAPLLQNFLKIRYMKVRRLEIIS
jgi:hypothetical protein